MEHHDHDIDGSDSAAAWIVGIVALLIVMGFALFAVRAFTLNRMTPDEPNMSTDINVTLPEVSPPATSANTDQGATVNP